MEGIFISLQVFLAKVLGDKRAGVLVFLVELHPLSRPFLRVLFRVDELQPAQVFSDVFAALFSNLERFPN